MWKLQKGTTFHLLVMMHMVNVDHILAKVKGSAKLQAACQCVDEVLSIRPREERK